MNTFEDEYIPLWQAFIAFSQDNENKVEDVIAAEDQFDKDVELLCLKFSHPPGRPNRRR